GRVDRTCHVSKEFYRAVWDEWQGYWDEAGIGATVGRKAAEMPRFRRVAGARSCLQRRISAHAWTFRWKARRKLPGFESIKISITQVSRVIREVSPDGGVPPCPL